MQRACSMPNDTRISSNGLSRNHPNLPLPAHFSQDFRESHWSLRGTVRTPGPPASYAPGVTLKSELGLFNVTGNDTIRQIAYEFLLAFHSNYGPVLYYFRDKARYWSKIAIFHTACIRRPN